MFPAADRRAHLKEYHQVERYLQDRTDRPGCHQLWCEAFCDGTGEKVLLANNLGLLWKQVTELGTDQMSVLMAWLGIAAFALQIYFDFSGYSDMAIGLGAVLGFHFPENFNYPYIAASVKDFWHRWHISLSTWFKEYVYIPLGGNRKGLPRQLFNILVVWMLTGIWHGCRMEFPVLGAVVCIFLILEKFFFGRYSGKCAQGVRQDLYVGGSTDQLGVFHWKVRRDPGLSPGYVRNERNRAGEFAGNVFVQ